MAGINIREISADTLVEILEHGQFSHIYLKAVLDKYGYLEKSEKDMLLGGGTLFLEGDKQAFEAAGHCAAYTFGDEDIFVCHGYSIAHKGASILVQRPIVWTSDGWPQLK